jgi:hypothetical protein
MTLVAAMDAQQTPSKTLMDIRYEISGPEQHMDVCNEAKFAESFDDIPVTDHRVKRPE